MTSMILAVEGLTVSFDGFKAVDDLNFYVEEKELHVVIGPNGAGKTTLLDMICGKTKPTAGTIEFKGLYLEKMLEYQITRAGVGRKFQNPMVYEDLTVVENLEISYPKKRDVIGCLFFNRNETVRNEIERIARMIFLDDQARSQGGVAIPRAEAVARDWHAVDAGPRTAAAGRTCRRHEREGARTDG